MGNGWACGLSHGINVTGKAIPRHNVHQRSKPRQQTENVLAAGRGGAELSLGSQESWSLDKVPDGWRGDHDPPAMETQTSPVLVKATDD